MNITRPIVVTVAIGLFSLALSACSGGASSPSGAGAPSIAPVSGSSDSVAPSTAPVTAPVSLDGQWKQANSHSTDSWQAATITGDTIEINWVSDNGDTTSLYWAGSVTPPTTPGDTFTWTSDNDTSKTESAMMASPDPTKEFTYDHGVISYSASLLGTTMKIKLEPQK